MRISSAVAPEQPFEIDVLGSFAEVEDVRSILTPFRARLMIPRQVLRDAGMQNVL
jgi:hypothetical protein